MSLKCMIIIVWFTAIVRSSETTSRNRTKIWLDTDIGTDPDDILAIMQLGASLDEYEIVGISTVGGNPNTGAPQVSKLLCKMGIVGIPIYVGVDTPLTTTNQVPDIEFVPATHYGFVASGQVYGSDETNPFECGSLKQDTEISPLSDIPVDEFNSAQFHFAIGPLTNFYHIFNMSSDYHVKNFVVMGGSILNAPETGFNHNEYQLYDYNLRVDPMGSMKVLTSPQINQVVLVSANITLQCFMRRSHLEAMRSAIDDYDFLKYAVRGITIWAHNIKFWAFKGYVDIPDDAVEFMHDPLTISYGYDPEKRSWLTFEPATIGYYINDNGVFQTVDMELYDVNNTDVVSYDEIKVHDVILSVDIAADDFIEWYFELILNYEYPTEKWKTCDALFPTELVSAAAITGFCVGFGSLCCCICCCIALRSMRIRYITRKRHRKETLVKKMVERYDTKTIELENEKMEEEENKVKETVDNDSTICERYSM